MEPRGIMGGFYKVSEWIMRLATINILWVICSIPFIFVSIPLILTGDLPEEQLLAQANSTLIIMGIIAPFILFPATAAMFTVARKWVMGETDVPLFKTYFRGYKENYKQSMIGGIIYIVLIAVMVVDFYFFRDRYPIVSYIFLALLVLLVISLFNFFSMLTHYHMKTFQLLKNAVLITIGRPFRSLSTAIMAGFILYISLFKFTFLIPFFMGSMIALLSFWNFYLVYQKLQDQAEKARIAAEEASEEEGQMDAEKAAELDREDLVKSDSNNPNK